MKVIEKMAKLVLKLRSILSLGTKCFLLDYYCAYFKDFTCGNRLKTPFISRGGRP